MKRRDFLTAVACASLGLTVMGCKSEPIVEGTIRFGILIDMKKLLEPGLTSKIIEACHSAHNVPSVPNASKKIQWIWEDTAHHTFSEKTSSLPTFSNRYHFYYFAITVVTLLVCGCAQQVRPFKIITESLVWIIIAVLVVATAWLLAHMVQEVLTILNHKSF